ncbi:MAG: hypothetical protein ABL907_13100 [Hyphomicrobium sp.]
MSAHDTLSKYRISSANELDHRIAQLQRSVVPSPGIVKGFAEIELNELIAARKELGWDSNAIGYVIMVVLAAAVIGAIYYLFFRR